MNEIVLPSKEESGRLVSGHPMVEKPKKDNEGKQKLDRNGTPMVSFYGGLAIPKQPGVDWKQTVWGQQFMQIAMAAYPNGEYNRPDFAFKIDDGDSTIPNKNNKIPCQREGWPGHWIIHASDGFAPPCYHDGNFNPYQCIQDKNEIKTGDYVQFIVTVEGNNKNGQVPSPGLYVNLKAVNLVRAGQRIATASEVDAAAGFGTGVTRNLPPGALLDNSVQPQAPAPQAPAPQAPVPGAPAPQAPVPVQPAHDFVQAPIAPNTPPPPGVTPVAVGVQPEPMYNINGQVYSLSALIAANYSDAQIAACPRHFDDDIPF